jgi:serine/threonine protein kinase
MGSLDASLRIDDSFEILENLGRGGVGSVYLARYKGDCLVAVKLLGTGRSSEESFVRESRILLTLRHPAIVSAYTSGRVSGVRYLVMEYVDGIDAREYRRRLGRPLTVAECAELLLPIADALAYCHSRGIFHGDVSPRNILVDAQGRADMVSAKLVDFGNSWDAEDTSATGGYVAESFDFQPVERRDPTGLDPIALGETSDVYALAATAYFLTAGRGGAGRVLSSDERSGVVALQADDDEAWNAMLVWALHADRRQRLPSMSLFRSLLRAWLPEASDRHDGSRIEPFWAKEALDEPEEDSAAHDTAATEPLDAEFVSVQPVRDRQGWWFDMMLESLPEHETGRTGEGSTVSTRSLRSARATRSIPMLAMGILLAFVAGLTLADLVQPADCVTEECR